MYSALSIFAILAALYYVAPETVVQRRQGSSLCKETSPVRSTCVSGTALTFYGGPSEDTMTLLTTLKKHGAFGTFIVSASASTDWDMVKNIAIRGHTLL